MKRVIICGLGALGLTYAVKIKNKCELRILVDKERFKRYYKQKPVFNNEPQEFEYILPSHSFNADLIIIATKAHGLTTSIENIKNFITGNTMIISLINGISSENKISEFYPNAHVIKSYFIGHSAMRAGNIVTQDGVGEIVVDNNPDIIKLFDELGINYSISDNIDYSMWLKFALNLFSNQTSAILNMTFGDMKQNKHFLEFAKKIINEIKIIGDKIGVKGLENLEQDALDALSKMSNDGQTSMLQDILAKRQTEVEIFAGEIITLGKRLQIPTPYNQVLYDLIKIKEEVNERSIHTC